MYSKSIIILFVVCFASHYSYGQRDKKFFRNDYKYIEESESFYKIHTVEATWSGAKRLCDLEGASLFYPEDENEANAVISFWNSTQTFSVVYIGISDILAEGVFESIDGRSIYDVYHNWNQYEPNNRYAEGGENCVTLNKAGTLNDVECSLIYSYICKKTLQSLEWNEHCDIPDLGFTLNEETGSCYKLHTNPLNWTDAYLLCNAEQSYLTVISSQQEADYLLKLSQTAPKHRVTGNYLRGVFHLGYHNRFNEAWRSVRGQSIHDGNNPWWGNCQFHGVDVEQCGSMFFDGKLNDIHCDTRCFFICEHDVNKSHLPVGKRLILPSQDNAV